MPHKPHNSSDSDPSLSPIIDIKDTAAMSISSDYADFLPTKKPVVPPMDIRVNQNERACSGSTMATVATVNTYMETGAPINRSQTADKLKEANNALRWARFRRALREAFSEFMGTFILIMFGDGVVAQVVLSGGEKGIAPLSSE